MLQKNFYIGIDVGGTKILAGLIDEDGNIHLRERFSTPQNARPRVIYEHLKKVIQDILRQSKIPFKNLNGIGLGIPGLVSPDHQHILVTPNIHLTKYPLAQTLRENFKTLVALGNDVNLGTLAEQWLGAGKNFSNIVGIFIGTGVGGAIIMEDRLLTGAQGCAGELGHMIIDLQSSKKSAGGYGTLEALVSRRAIEKNIREAIARGRKTIISELTSGNLEVIKSKMISHALREKDPLMVEIMTQVCAVLGKTCISLRHIFNPDMIILGGGVIEACGDFIIPRVKKISTRDPFFAGVDQCRIVPSLLADDAVMLGAAGLVKQLVENQGNEKNPVK